MGENGGSDEDCYVIFDGDEFWFDFVKKDVDADEDIFSYFDASESLESDSHLRGHGDAACEPVMVSSDAISYHEYGIFVVLYCSKILWHRIPSRVVSLLLS